MNKSKKLTALFTAVVMVSMFSGASASAETRHRDETRRDEWRNNNRGQRNSTGAWNRAGVFDAHNVADLRPTGYGRYGYDDRY